MNRPTATEAIAVLTMLAVNRVDIREVVRITDRLPEIARRPQEYCPSGNPHECSVFGITWWVDSDTYGGYRVCIEHGWADGPSGPLARRLPYAHKDTHSTQREGRALRVMALVPHLDRIAWAVCESGARVGSGVEELPRVHDDVLGGIATWLAHALRSYEPESVLISRHVSTEHESERTAVAAMGIKMRTRNLDSPAVGPTGFLLAERIVGVLYGIASTVCGGSVYLSDAYDMNGANAVTQTPQDSALRDAFAAALSVATAHYATSDSPTADVDSENS